MGFGTSCRLSTVSQSLLPQAWQGRPAGDLHSRFRNLLSAGSPSRCPASMHMGGLSVSVAAETVICSSRPALVSNQIFAAPSCSHRQAASLHTLRQSVLFVPLAPRKVEGRRPNRCLPRICAEDGSDRALGNPPGSCKEVTAGLLADHCSPWVSWDVQPVVYSNPTGAQRDPSLASRLPPPRLSVAPMMEYTDNHFRQLARLLSRHTWLYTEMVVDNTLLHQQPHLDRWLEFPGCQHPVVLQLGGSDVASLAQAARLADAYGYDEINLNCGCPSSAVAGHGCFGARLMLEPERVGDALSAMAAACSVPVTVKCRIGVDDHDSYEELCHFVGTVADRSPVRHFAIHARKALLKGLSPAQNRSVPPLRYEYVAALMRDFPDLHFTLNGGIQSLAEAADALAWGVHGVMIGRAACKNPWAILGDADRAIYGVPNRAVSRRQVLAEYAQYADGAKGRYGPHRPNVRALIMPLLSLFHAEPGGANWRRELEVAVRTYSTVQAVLDAALPAVPDAVLDAPPGPPAGNPTRLADLGPLPAPPQPAAHLPSLLHQGSTGKWPQQEVHKEGLVVEEALAG